MITTDEFKVNDSWHSLRIRNIFKIDFDELQEAVRKTCIGKKYGEFPQVSERKFIFIRMLCEMWEIIIHGKIDQTSEHVLMKNPKQNKNKNFTWAFHCDLNVLV